MDIQHKHLRHIIHQHKQMWIIPMRIVPMWIIPMWIVQGLAVLVCMSSAFAQQQPTTPATETSASFPASFLANTVRFGITGGVGQQFHGASFLTVPRGVAELVDDANGLTQDNKAYSFQSGTGTGWNIGGLIEFPLHTAFSLGVRASLAGRNGTLLSREFSTPVGRRDGSEDEGRFVRRFDASLATVGGEVLVGWNPWNTLHVYLGARVDFAYQKTFRQQEELLAPSDGTFDNGLRVRNVQSGVLPDVRNWGVANLNAGLIGGVGYEIPLGNGNIWTLEPSIMGNLGLLNVMQNMKPDEYWRVSTLSGNVALRYYPTRAAMFNEQEYRIEQLQLLEKRVVAERTKIQEELRELQQSGLIAEITKVVGIQDDGTTVEQPSIYAEEVPASSVVEWLPNVFFGEGSSVIPARYKRLLASDTKNLSLEKLAADKSPLTAYYNALNIVGKRMREQPSTTLVLKGVRANSGAEATMTNLARRRAEAVREYLQSVWGISAERVTIEEKTVQPSALNNSSAAGEGHAVELSSTDASLLAPLTFAGTTRILSPSSLEIDINIRSGKGIKQWSLEVSQFLENEVQTLKVFEGTGVHPKKLFWNIQSDCASLVGNQLTMTLNATDVNNRTTDAPTQVLNVQYIAAQNKREPNGQKNQKKIDTVIGLLDATTFGLSLPTIQHLRQVIQPSSTVMLGFESSVEKNSSALTKQIADLANQLGMKPTDIRVLPARNVAEALATLPEQTSYRRLVVWQIETPTR